MKKKSLKNPRASKNLILSLLALNPGKSFTTDEIHEIALGSEYTSQGFYREEILTKVRSNITGLRRDGWPIDSLQDRENKEQTRYCLRNAISPGVTDSAKRGQKRGRPTMS